MSMHSASNFSLKITAACSVAFFLVGLTISGAITANWYKSKSKGDKERIAALEKVIRASVEFDRQTALTDKPAAQSIKVKPEAAPAIPSAPPPPSLQAKREEKPDVVVAPEIVRQASKLTPEPASKEIARKPVEKVTPQVNAVARIDPRPALRQQAAESATKVALATPATPSSQRVVITPKVLPAPKNITHQETDYEESSRMVARVVTSDPDSDLPAKVVSKNRSSGLQAQPLPPANASQQAENRLIVPAKTPSYNVNDSAVVDVAEVEKNNKVEGVSADKIGVKQISEDGVTVRNGSQIRLGERFPSGERLLKVDPTAAKIVTDKRTILLL